MSKTEKPDVDRVKVWLAVMVVMNAGCASAVNRSPVRESSSQVRPNLPDCRTGNGDAPEPALNFDMFVATSADLLRLFPGSRPPRSSPVAKMVTEVRDPFEGRLIAGPFHPPLVVHSYEPDEWPSNEARVDLSEASARKLPWMECGGLSPGGFEALGDALGLPTPPPHEVERVLGVIPERLTTPIFLPPANGGIVGLFPEAFESALAATGDTEELGRRWSDAFRTRQIEGSASAKAHGFAGRDEPPPDAERLRPYFIGLAADVVELAKQATATERNLYVHHWPD